MPVASVTDSGVGPKNVHCTVVPTSARGGDCWTNPAVTLTYWVCGAATPSSPILPVAGSANQTAPSVPAAMPRPAAPGAGIGKSVAAPDIEIVPMVGMPRSVNHMLPSGPAVMSNGALPVGSGNSVTAPAGVIRPIRSPARSVNQRFPSGPAAIRVGAAAGVGRRKIWIRPVVALILPIRSAPASVNHTAPSGPAVIPRGPLPPASRYDVTLPPVTWAIRSVPGSVNQVPSAADAMSSGRAARVGIQR